MHFRRRRYQDNNNMRINLAPLIDTMFLLLIFFLMTATFNQQSQLHINLPQAKGEEVSQDQEEPIRIIIDAQGHYAINDNEHSLINTELETLKRALVKAAKGASDPALLISADAQAPHHAVIEAMEAARDLGFVRLSFEAQKPPQ